MSLAYREVMAEPPRPAPRLLTDLTLDELWEMQPKRSRAW
jgi:hypothetical protein